MTTAPNDPAEVVRAYHHAWTSGDTDLAATYLADHARFRAPGEEVMGKDDWCRYLAGFVPRLVAAPGHAELVDGDRVALWYFPQTAATTSAMAGELFTVEDGRIVDLRLVFDRASYLPDGEAPPS